MRVPVCESVSAPVWFRILGSAIAFVFIILGWHIHRTSHGIIKNISSKLTLIATSDAFYNNMKFFCLKSR